MASVSATAFLLDGEIDEIVIDAINYIFEVLSEKINDNYIATLEIPYTAKIALQKVNKIVSLATAPHDGSIFLSKANTEDFLEFLEPDNEPLPSTIDTWARGVVNTKKAAVEDSGYSRSVPKAPNSAPSVSSFRSSVTGRSRGVSMGTKHRTSAAGGSQYGGGMGKSVGGSAFGDGNTASPNLDQTGKIIELADEADDFSNLNSTGPLFDQLQRTKRNKAQGYVQKDTTEKDEFEVIKEQLEKAAKDLNGKNFVLDRYGKPVVVGRVNTESLPPLSLSLALNVTSANSNGDTIDESKMLDKDKKKGRPFIRVAGSRGVEESFRPIVSLATSLTGIENIPKVNQGVSIKSSTDVRKGEDIPDDPKRMSRKQYISRSTLSMSLNDTSMTSFGKSSPTGMRDERATIGFPDNGLNNSTTSLSIQTSKSIEMLPDIDNFEGGKKVTFDSPTLHDMSDEELGLGPVKAKVTTEQQKLNLKPLPKKTAQQKESTDKLHGNPENGNPRDRDLPKNMKPMAERRHLPPPPLGQITGHGTQMTVEKLKQRKELQDAYEEEFNVKDSDWTSKWRS